MKRREFIILTGVGATSATVLSACGHPENKLIPALIPDNEYVPGLDYWKASTCAMCEAGCGIVVRTREHKANKIEGNPPHPVNRGALCARGQAGLQLLYNPDRIRGPLKRTGERGSGQFAEIGWDEAIKTLADKLREIGSERLQGRAGSAVFMTGDQGGVTAHVAERFMDAYGLRSIVASPALSGPEYPIVPDIANATYLLSFGARFLETWQSPVMYSLAYGEFRRSSGKARGRFVQVEPRMSLTGANADEWLPAAVGSEWLVALALAQVIAREGLARKSPSPELAGSLERFAPEKITGRVDVPSDKLIRIAREFAGSERPLALAGTFRSGSPNSIDFLNLLVDNADRRGGMLMPVGGYFDPFEKLRPRNAGQVSSISQWGFTEFLNRNSLNALMLHRFNPVYAAPAAIDKIKDIPFIASFSSFRDETTELADLVLPDHSYLESWDLNVVRRTTEGVLVSLTQPVVKPEFNTRQTADVLIALGRQLGGAVADAMPFGSSEEVVKQAIADLPKSGGSISAETPDDFWKTFVERGVWVGNAETTFKYPSKPAAPSLPAAHMLDTHYALAPPQPEADEYPLVLLTYEHAAFGDGSFANLPWLQELPDPMTSVMWGSWVEINPKTAASLGINDGDLLEVRTTGGAVTAPALLYPAIRPDCVAMPYGQGHTAYGRYASNRGANAALLNPLSSMTGEAMTIRARVTKVPGEARQIKFGTEMLERIETHRPR
jgi:menaquinone reductase, molybdopterin-binding-like subunit